MTRERWAQVERVLDAVLDHEPHEWDATIARLCDGDAELLAEVRVARSGPRSRAAIPRSAGAGRNSSRLGRLRRRRGAGGRKRSVPQRSIAGG